jgi:hypothetical protein
VADVAQLVLHAIRVVGVAEDERVHVLCDVRLQEPIRPFL